MPNSKRKIGAFEPPLIRKEVLMKGLSDSEQKIVEQAIGILDSYLRTELVTFHEPCAVKIYLRLRLAKLDREQFNCLYLDSQHRLIVDEVLFMGSLDACNVFPRIVVQNALKHNAAAVIFAHNHPSGVPDPSRADRAITERLQSALALVDVKVLDHIVVGDPETTSFAERGYL